MLNDAKTTWLKVILGLRVGPRTKVRECSKIEVYFEGEFEYEFEIMLLIIQIFSLRMPR